MGPFFGQVESENHIVVNARDSVTFLEIAMQHSKEARRLRQLLKAIQLHT